MAHPKNTPTAVPSRAPNTAMITDSQRIMDLTCRLIIPTALRSPISRVLS